MGQIAVVTGTSLERRSMATYEYALVGSWQLVLADETLQL